MRLDSFDYHLPPDRIAQQPLSRRDQARLLVLQREDGRITHRRFRHLKTMLTDRDVLVLNDTRVLPARLHGVRDPSGGKVEFLLLRERESGVWEALVRPGRRLQVGAAVRFSATLSAEVVDRTDSGARLVRFSDPRRLQEHLRQMGRVPLPPYIHRELEDPERYQTVYAHREGSAAAPTAGLHFTPGLLTSLRRQGVQTEFVTLHIGLDTFRPVKAEDIEDHDMHSEAIEVLPETAEALNQARRLGKRLIAVGTTSVRVLESAADPAGVIRPCCEQTRLYITPGYRFRAVDALLTNFHLPRTTLLVLVSAFAGRENILRAYQTALDEGYRFLSFGDAMFIE